MMIRRSRPTIAWYSLDRRTASGSTTSLASYTNPPVSAAPARAVRSGREARYERDSTDRAPVLMSISVTVRLLWVPTAFGPASGVDLCAHFKPTREQAHGRAVPTRLVSWADLCSPQGCVPLSLFSYRHRSPKRPHTAYTISNDMQAKNIEPTSGLEPL